MTGSGGIPQKIITANPAGTILDGISQYVRSVVGRFVRVRRCNELRSRSSKISDSPDLPSPRTFSKARLSPSFYKTHSASPSSGQSGSRCQAVTAGKEHCSSCRRARASRSATNCRIGTGRTTLVISPLIALMDDQVLSSRSEARCGVHPFRSRS